MYFIVNITKPPREITIGDLNFCLGPNKAIDLEKVRKRSEIDDSKDLKNAIKGRKVQVRHSSKYGEEDTVKIEAPAVSYLVSEADLEKIRDAVREEFKSQLSQLSKSQGVSSEITEMLGKITSLIEQGGVSQPLDKIVKDESDTISEDLLVKMNERTIRNRTQNTEGNIQSDETKVEGSATSKAKRLRDLMKTEE